MAKPNAEHMDVSRFVRLFIRKERRERLLWELTRPRTPAAGLVRFCHSSRALIDPRAILMEGGDLERRDAFRRFLAAREGLCFVLSPDFCPDGALLPPERAVALAAMSCDAALILGSDFAVVFGEAEKGGRDKLLLSDERALAPDKR